MNAVNALAQLSLAPQVKTIVCLGTGGVGKTTTAAAVGAFAAAQGRAALVVTVDPAARLAQLMGRTDFAEASSEPWLPHAIAGQPGLSMVQLNAPAVFDAAVREALPHEQAQRLLHNRYYRLVADAFAGSADYMAAELVGRLRDRIDTTNELLVVDTAPAVSAFDFLDAPARLAAFTDSRFVKTLRDIGTGQRGSGLTRRLISAVLGADLTSEVAELLTSLHDALVAMRVRADRTLEHLKSSSSTFLLITRPAADQVSPVQQAAENLRTRGYALSACVVNQMPPQRDQDLLNPDQLTRTAIALEATNDNQALALSDGLRLLIQMQRTAMIEQSLATTLINASQTTGVRMPKVVDLSEPTMLAKLIHDSL